MPVISIWFIRISLFWMLFGALNGLFIYLEVDVISFRNVHIFAMTHGWLLGFVLGVAWWIFPRTGKNNRPPERPAWAGFWLIQAGLCGLVFLPTINEAIPGALLLSGCLFIIIPLLKRVKKRGHKHE